MSPAITPIALLRQRDIEHCLQRARAALESWEQEWLSHSGLELACTRSIDSLIQQPDGAWSAYRNSQGALIWCYQSADLVRSIESKLFGLDDTVRNMDRHRESRLALEVANRAVEDLAATVLQQVVGSVTGHFSVQAELVSKPDPTLFKHYSGSALLKVLVGAATLAMLIPHGALPHGTISSPTNPKRSLTPLPAALNNVELRVHAELGDVEMTLGNFASLQVGDVIDLSISLEQPLTVYTENRTAIGAAYLGQQSGFRALSMFKLPHK